MKTNMLEVFKANNIEYSDLCDKDLLNCTSECIYCISHINLDGTNEDDRVVKPGYTGDGEHRPVIVRLFENISEIASKGLSISKMQFRIEFIIKVPEWISLKYKTPDKHIHTEIMEKMLGLEAVRNSFSTRYSKTEYFKNVDVVKLYNYIEYYFEYKTIDHDAIAERMNLKLYPLQEREVEKCIRAFNNGVKEYLLNACCRFGKTYFAYGLMRSLYKNKKCKIFIYSFKTEVSPEWYEMAIKLGYYVILEDRKNTGKNKISMEEQYNEAVKKGYKKIVCIASVADIYGEDNDGYVKEKNRWIHKIQWELAIGDEFHYGIHNKNASNTFVVNNEETSNLERKLLEKFTRNEVPIIADRILYLTATGYASFENGRFSNGYDGSIVTYTDMKREKEYASIPRVKILSISYVEKIIQDYILQTNANQFSFAKLLKAIKKGDKYVFLDYGMAHRFLASIFASRTKEGKTFFGSNLDESIIKALDHIIIVLDEVNSCFALKRMLEESFPNIKKKYFIRVVAGDKVDALTEKEILKQKMQEIANGDEIEFTGTITITCGKLLTGVSVEYWSSIFLLTDRSCAEFMHQACGRLYTPRVDKKTKETIKTDVLIVDPDPNRALYFRHTIDACEKIKNPEKTDREIYYDTSLLVDFGDMAEAGTIIDINFDKMIEYTSSAKRNYADYLARHSLVTDNPNILMELNDEDFNKIRVKKNPSVYWINQITANSLIDKAHNTIINGDTKKTKGKDKLDIKREILINIGTKFLASFCWVNFKNKITCYDDIRKMPEEYVRKYFQIGFETFDKIFNIGGITHNTFETLISIYNNQYNELRKELAKCE